MFLSLPRLFVSVHKLTFRVLHCVLYTHFVVLLGHTLCLVFKVVLWVWSVLWSLSQPFIFSCMNHSSLFSTPMNDLFLHTVPCVVIYVSCYSRFCATMSESLNPSCMTVLFPREGMPSFAFPALWKQRQQISEFKDSLLYRVCSRTAGATQKKPWLEKPKPKISKPIKTLDSGPT